MFSGRHGFEEESPEDFDEGSLERLLSCVRHRADVYEDSLEKLLSCVRHRADHVTVVWKDKTLIWGGYGSGTDCEPFTKLNSIKDVYCYEKGTWSRNSTMSDLPIDADIENAPIEAHGCRAEVVNDTMYIMEKYINTELHALDLNAWRWEKILPSGKQPGIAFDTSWSYRGKI